MTCFETVWSAGINDNRIQRRLLAESDLDFQKAFCIAQTMESADKSVIDLLKGDPHSSTVSPGPSHIHHRVPSEPVPPGQALSSMAVNSLNDDQEKCMETYYCCGGRHNQLFVGFEMSNTTDVASRVISSRCAARKHCVTNNRVI